MACRKDPELPLRWFPLPSQQGQPAQVWDTAQVPFEYMNFELQYIYSTHMAGISPGHSLAILEVDLGKHAMEHPARD